jgi:hypothetical protein
MDKDSAIIANYMKPAFVLGGWILNESIDF